MISSEKDPGQAPKGVRRPLLARLLTRENLAALLVCLILIAVIIMTSDAAPRWIYQGF